MNVPPKKNELFKWRKGAKRLSDWMVQGGFAPIDEGIRSLKPPTLVAAPPLQSRREAQREAMWQRVAGRARVRTLTSVEGNGEDATLTRSLVRSVMDDSRGLVKPTENRPRGSRASSGGSFCHTQPVGNARHERRRLAGLSYYRTARWKEAK